MAGKNLLVNGKNKVTAGQQAISNIQKLKNTASNPVNTATPNLPITTTKAVNPLVKATPTTPTTTPVVNSTPGITTNNPAFQYGNLKATANNDVLNASQSRFIGFQNTPQSAGITTTQRQGHSWNKFMNGGYNLIQSDESKAQQMNNSEEMKYRSTANALMDFQGDVYKNKGKMTEAQMKKLYPEFKDNIDVLKELQTELRPIVKGGMGVDAQQLENLYPELLQSKNLVDVDKIKQQSDLTNQNFQNFSKRIDKLLNGKADALSVDGLKYLQSSKNLIDAVTEYKKKGVVGGANDYEILKYAIQNNPQLQQEFDVLKNSQLTDSDRKLLKSDGNSGLGTTLDTIVNSLSSMVNPGIAIKNVAEGASQLATPQHEKYTNADLQQMINAKENLDGETWQNFKTKLNVPIDSLKKRGQRTANDLGAEVLKGVLKNSLGDDVDKLGVNTDKLFENLIDKPKQRQVEEYQKGVNERYKAKEEKNLNQDVKNYYDRKGLTELLANGDLKGFWYKAAGDMASNIEMPAVIGLSIIQPEVGLALMATDSYARENQEAYEQLRERGASYEDAQQDAAIVGLASASVEIFLEKALGGVETTASEAIRDMIMNNFRKEVTDMVAERGLAELLKQGAVTQFKSSFEEGLEEVVQQAIQNAAIQKYDPNQEITEGLWTAFEGGFYNPMNLLGGGMDIAQGVYQNSDVIKQNAYESAYNLGQKTRNVTDKVDNALNKGAYNAGVKAGQAYNAIENMRNKSNSQGGKGNIQQQGQGTQVNTTSANGNNINGDNYNQKSKNSKTLNSVQLGLLKSNNRMNPTKITEFQDKFGVDYGQALADMGYTESHETNVPKIEKDVKEIYNEKKNAMNSVEGEFQDEALGKMLEMMVQRAENTWDREMLKKYQALQEKHDTKGLTMAEANDMREEFSYKIKTKWNTENNSEKIDLANNVYTAVKDFLEKTAEANGIKDLQKMNRDIAMRKYLSTWIGDKAERQSANNMVSLTDWVMIAEAAASPYAAAGLVTKKIMQQPKVKNAVLNAVVGRRENRSIDQQNRQAQNKERMENIESANEGKRLQEELSIPETPALPNGIKLTKVTEINNPRNKVTSKKKTNTKNKKSDSSSSDDTTPPTGGTPTGGTPTTDNGTSGGTPTATNPTDNTKKTKKTEKKNKVTQKKSDILNEETPQIAEEDTRERDRFNQLSENETPQTTEEEQTKTKITETAKNKVTNKPITIKVEKGQDVKPDNSGITGRLRNLTVEDYRHMQEFEGMEDEYSKGDENMIKGIMAFNDALGYLDPKEYRDFENQEDIENPDLHKNKLDVRSFVEEGQLLDRIRKGETTKEDEKEYDYFIDDYDDKGNPDWNEEMIIDAQKDLISEIFDTNETPFITDFYDQYEKSAEYMGKKDLSKQIQTFKDLNSKYGKYWEQGQMTDPKTKQKRSMEEFLNNLQENETAQIPTTFEEDLQEANLRELEENETPQRAEESTEKNAINEFKEKTKQQYQPVNNETPEEVEARARDYIMERLHDNDIYNVKIVDLAIGGSRSRGLANDNSDVDIVVEFEDNPDYSEDYLFDVLNDDMEDNGRMRIEGVDVDFNPILRGKTGTLGEYLQKAEKYLEEKAKKTTKKEINNVDDYIASKFNTRYGINESVDFWKQATDLIDKIREERKSDKQAAREDMEKLESLVGDKIDEGLVEMDTFLTQRRKEYDKQNAPKTTTEITGEKNTVTAKKVEENKPKNLVTSKSKVDEILEKANGAKLKVSIGSDGDSYLVMFNADGKDQAYTVTDNQLKELNDKGANFENVDERAEKQAKIDKEVEQNIKAFERTEEKPKDLVTNPKKAETTTSKGEIQEIDKDTWFDDIARNPKAHQGEMFIYKDGNYFYPKYILPSGLILSIENSYWGETSSEEAARNWLLKQAEEHSEENENKKAEKLKNMIDKTADKYESTLKRIESENPMQEIRTSGDYFKYGMGDRQMAKAKKEAEANAQVGTFKKDVIDGKEGYRIFVAGTKNEAIRAFYDPKTGKTYRYFRGPKLSDAKPYSTSEVERIEKFLENVEKQLDKETKKEKVEKKDSITQEWLDSLTPDKDGVIELPSNAKERYALKQGKETLIKEGKADGKYLYNYATPSSPQYGVIYIKDGNVYNSMDGLDGNAMKTKQDAIDWLNEKEKDVKHEATERYNEKDYETLPKTISVEEESEKAGPKRIAPNRVKWQQETYEKGLENVKDIIKQKRVVFSDLGFKSLRGKAVKNIRDEITRIRQLPEAEAEKQYTELAKSIYEDLVIKDISKGYRYPEDVTSKFPKTLMKKAIDARARYEKGLFTSFSAKDTRANNQYRDEIGAGIKSQDGKPVTQEQMNEIVDGIRAYSNIFGVNMKKFAEDNNVIYVHLHGGNPFLMGGMSIAGLYRRDAGGNISVSLGGREGVMEKGEDGKMKKSDIKTTTVHEITHAVDGMLEGKLFSDADVEILKKTMNKPSELINYYNRKQEIVARAVEQYAAHQLGKKLYRRALANIDRESGNVEFVDKEANYVDREAYWNQENFDKYVKPIVERNMNEKMKDYKIEQTKNNITATDKNKVTNAAKAYRPEIRIDVDKREKENTVDTVNGEREVKPQIDQENIKGKMYHVTTADFENFRESDEYNDEDKRDWNDSFGTYVTDAQQFFEDFEENSPRDNGTGWKKFEIDVDIKKAALHPYRTWREFGTDKSDELILDWLELVDRFDNPELQKELVALKMFESDEDFDYDSYDFKDHYTKQEILDLPGSISGGILDAQFQGEGEEVINSLFGDDASKDRETLKKKGYDAVMIYEGEKDGPVYSYALFYPNKYKKTKNSATSNDKNKVTNG